MAVDISPVLAMISQTPGAAVGQGLANLGQILQQNKKLDLESKQVQMQEDNLKLQQAQDARKKQADALALAGMKQKLQANVAFGAYNLRNTPEYLAAVESGDAEKQQALLDEYNNSISGTMEAMGVPDTWKDSFKKKDKNSFLAIAVQDPEIYKMLNPTSDTKEWQMVAKIATIPENDRTPEEKRVFDALMNRRDPTAQQVGTTINEIVQTEDVLKSIGAVDKVANTDAYTNAVATKADSLREKARVKGEVLSLEDSVKAAVSMAEIHMKPREGISGLVSGYVPGMAEMEYDPTFINPDVMQGMLVGNAKKVLTPQKLQNFMSSNNLSAYDAIQIINDKYK